MENAEDGDDQLEHGEDEAKKLEHQLKEVEEELEETKQRKKNKARILKAETKKVNTLDRIYEENHDKLQNYSDVQQKAFLNIMMKKKAVKNNGKLGNDDSKENPALELIEKMTEAFFLDQDSNKVQQPALCKLKMMGEVQK